METLYRTPMFTFLNRNPRNLSFHFLLFALVINCCHLLSLSLLRGVVGFHGFGTGFSLVSLRKVGLLGRLFAVCLLILIFVLGLSLLFVGSCFGI